MIYSIVPLEGMLNITGEDVGGVEIVGYGDGGITGLCVGKGLGGSVGCVAVGDMVGLSIVIMADRISLTKFVVFEPVSHVTLPVFKMQSTCIGKVPSKSPKRVSFNEIPRIWSM